MKRFRFDFIALTPKPEKIKMCVESDSIIKATREVMSQFNVRYGPQPNIINPKIREFPVYSNDPRVSECHGCSICNPDTHLNNETKDSISGEDDKF